MPASLQRWTCTATSTLATSIATPIVSTARLVSPKQGQMRPTPSFEDSVSGL
jgi:hypothetical protein